MISDEPLNAHVSQPLITRLGMHCGCRHRCTRTSPRTANTHPRPCLVTQVFFSELVAILAKDSYKDEGLSDWEIRLTRGAKAKTHRPRQSIPWEVSRSRSQEWDGEAEGVQRGKDRHTPCSPPPSLSPAALVHLAAHLSICATAGSAAVEHI